MTIPLASHNGTNRGTEEKEDTNVRERTNREKEWTNRKDCGYFCDGWDFLLWIIISIIIIDCILNFFIVITKFEQNTEQKC